MNPSTSSASNEQTDGILISQSTIPSQASNPIMGLSPMPGFSTAASKQINVTESELSSAKESKQKSEQKFPKKAAGNFSKKVAKASKKPEPRFSGISRQELAPESGPDTQAVPATVDPKRTSSRSSKSPEISSTSPVLEDRVKIRRTHPNVRPIPIARNLTAFLQAIQRVVATGHYYWTGDEINPENLPKLIAKWEERFGLRADTPARAYRKKTKRASVHLLVHPAVREFLVGRAEIEEEIGDENSVEHDLEFDLDGSEFVDLGDLLDWGGQAYDSEPDELKNLAAEMRNSAAADQQKNLKKSEHDLPGALPAGLLAPPIVSWWMFSTAGKNGLTENFLKRTDTAPGSKIDPKFSPNLGQISLPGKVRDCRTIEGRIVVGHYELIEIEKSYIDGSKFTEVFGKNSAGNSNKTAEKNQHKSDSVSQKKVHRTWTWRMTPKRHQEWEALIAQTVKARDREGLKKIYALLAEMPMFAGVRGQVLRLQFEGQKLLRKTKSDPIQMPELAVMRMIELWETDFGL